MEAQKSFTKHKQIEFTNTYWKGKNTTVPTCRLFYMENPKQMKTQTKPNLQL